MEQAAQGGGGVTISGGNFQSCGDVALSEHGGGGLVLDLVFFVVFANHSDSMIL